MLNIVLFGPPGAGKGTQARLLAERYNLSHISTGEAIRREIRAGSACGESVKEYIERGELAPDELVLDIVSDYVESRRPTAGNIFDGFPRTEVQAEEFDKILAAHGKRVDLMLSLEVPDEVLIERLLLRGRESGRMDDASEKVIRNRIKVYNAQTAVVAQFYADQGKYMGIKGTGTVEEIFARLCKAIDKVQE